MVDLSSLQLQLNPASDEPIYRQLADAIGQLIEMGSLPVGERLPATRDLAGRLGLNRTTVSAAYTVLEESGLIEGHVGRGSFVAERRHSTAAVSGPGSVGFDWESILPPLEPRMAAIGGRAVDVNFLNARPAREAFPLAAFRKLAKQVIDGPEAAEILQLGSPYGYAPLRRYLLDEAQNAGIARAGDDLIITNGCQQALDLIARLLTAHGETAALEDPVYYGQLRVFARAGARLVTVPVGGQGLDTEALEPVLDRERPRLLVVTPTFQNPTGATIPLARRQKIIALAQKYGVVLVENDVYGELRYCGSALPSLKQLDESGNTILLRSYSKVSFPGLRVGWAIAPRAVLARLAEAKQTSDLHSDQLSQAVLLRFAESGELARHLELTRAAGADRLETVLKACERYLPPGATFTRPEGGMNLWIELPAPLLAEDIFNRVQERGVSFLPGRYFSPNGGQPRGLRISFGGLAPDQIARGMQILGDIVSRELAAARSFAAYEPEAALV
ncbi:MAG TPA: PLP-dependent aminotransferase family protein [Bryobacteraceae bacterium]|jgi:2-aminoadipate transaminase|nr:PLP-dependent aminotransferase family protein [Bryobacteraceae bacterium]